jgi:RNA polymerase sigma factor (sigma-70 family)
MPDDPLCTTRLQHWARRIRAGDRAAPDELLRAAGSRLEALARKMLRRFPSLRRWEETADVFQNAIVRLLRALHQVEPGSVRDFFGLAAEQMRRELLDLARHHNGPGRHGAQHASQDGNPDGPAFEPADQPAEADDLERWEAFHEAVANLPAEEREVVGLVYYHGWTQVEVADLLQITERTVRRRWQAACLKLSAALKEHVGCQPIRR